MKKIFIISSLLFLMASQAISQVQASLKPVSPTSPVIIITIKPAVTVTTRVSGVSLSIAIPIPDAGSTVPTLSFNNSANTSLAWVYQAVGTTIINGVNNYLFDFQATGNVTLPADDHTYTAGTDNELVRVSIIGDPTKTAKIKLVSYQDYGTSGNTNFGLSFNGVDVASVLTPFYAIPTLSIAQNSAVTVSLAETLNSISLPTKFISFFATKQNENANLTWTVDNEENNNFFEVLRSFDGRSFTSIAKVQALRNGKSVNTYTLPDANLSSFGKKTIYYQIKGFETSGNLISSEIRSINLDAKNFTAQLYPNPVKSFTKLVVDAPEAGKAVVIVRDLSGKTVQQISMEFVKGVNQKEINASMLAAGDYNVTIVSEKLNQTIKLTKTN